MNEILVGDAIEKLREMPQFSVQCCVTSPPYWGLRDYGIAGQIGLERHPHEYVEKMVAVFREVRRVLRDDGTLWLNLGDSYARNGGESGGENRELLHMDGAQRRMTSIPEGSGLKPKDLVGMPWRVAFALQSDGWFLRSDIIWSKPNPMPESVTDRPTKAHEYLFLMSKGDRYLYDSDAIREPYADATFDRIAYGCDSTEERLQRHQPGAKERKDPKYQKLNAKGRNRRTVWSIPTEPFSEAHFATFPEKLVEPCILAGAPAGAVVLDPFMGAGTVALVALKAGRQFIGVELNPEYAKIAEARIWQEKNQSRLA